MSLAMIAGVLLGTLLSNLGSWRTTFLFVAMLAPSLPSEFISTSLAHTHLEQRLRPAVVNELGQASSAP